MENFIAKRKPTIGISLFTALSGSFSFDKPKSPRDFQNGVVGLSIVAAMTDSDKVHEAFVSSKTISISPRSCSIPIVSSSKPTANFRGGFNLEKESEVVVDDELSESYTCITSHFGSRVFQKRVYFNGELELINGCSVVRSGVFSTSPMSFGVAERGFCAAEFLSSCYLCRKQLHGLDIFMYRGEKAFCSIECRDRHIRGDDCRDKCGSKVMKDYSVSPCSVAGPLALASGVVAA